MYEITHTHQNGLLTEVLSFKKASRHSNGIKKKILADLEAAGADGLTPDEFLLIHGGIINTIRRRFTDLWKEGKIQHHPTLLARKNPAGNECVAWVIGKDTNFSLRRAKRTWVGLTGTEINHIIAANVGYLERMVKEVENLLREKNSD
jgi:hypothetical protein